MHIGLLSEHSDPARGGGEGFLHALAARLLACGHSVTHCARTGPKGVWVRAFPAATRPRRYAARLLPRLREAGAEVVLATSPVKGCDFYQPHNGILAASIPPHLDPLPWGLRHLRRANPVRLLHFAMLRRCEAEAVAPPARVLALSPRVVDDLGRSYPGAQALLRRPGVDLDRFTPGPPRAGAAPVLLFVAQNFRLKGLDALLRAVARLPKVRLLVAGGDRPRGGERVEYLGRVADLPALYRRASLLVHPTFYDTAALVVMEALACGLPVVTSARDGNSDLAVEGGGAAVPDPRDDAALARAIEEALARADPARARAVAERFPEEAMLDRIVETLTCGS